MGNKAKNFKERLEEIKKNNTTLFEGLCILITKDEKTAEGIYNVRLKEGVQTDLCYSVLAKMVAEVIAHSRPQLKEGVAQHLRDVFLLVERGVLEAPPQPGESAIIYGANGRVVPAEPVQKQAHVGPGSGGKSDPSAN